MLKFPGDTMKSCPICGKRVQVKSMRRHEVTHAGNPTLQCPECDTRPFRHKYQLDVHVANKHQGKTYLCSICNREFDSPNAVGVHRRDKHDLPGYVRCTIAECKSKKFLRRHAASHLDRVHDLRDVTDVSQYVVDVPSGVQEETVRHQQQSSTSGSTFSAYAPSGLSFNVPSSDSSMNLGEPSEGSRRRYSPSSSSTLNASPSRSSVSPLNDMRGPTMLSSPVLLKPQTAKGPPQRTSSDPRLSYTNPASFPVRHHEPRTRSEISEREHNSAHISLPSFNSLFPDVSRLREDPEPRHVPVPTLDRTGYPAIPLQFVQTVSSPVCLYSPAGPCTLGQRHLESFPTSPSMRPERSERLHSASPRDIRVDAQIHQQWTEGSSRDMMIRTQTPSPSPSRRLSISDILNPDERRPSSAHATASPGPRMYSPGLDNNVSSFTHPKSDGSRHSY